jgi:hypothetical protein
MRRIYHLEFKRKKMNKFIKKMFGIDKIEHTIAEAEAKLMQAIDQTAEHQQEAERARQAAVQAKEAERLAKLGPKELATEKKEPWVAVLDTHVNKDNIRNGFFELDWNEYFVLQLKESGYQGDTEEAVVDQWFQELCRGVGSDTGVDMDRRGSGYINVNNLGDGKSEVY